MKLNSNGNMTKVGLYEQLSNMSYVSTASNLPGYEKLDKEERNSHSYAEMPNSSTKAIPGPSTSNTIPTASSVVQNAIYRDSEGSDVTGTVYEYSGTMTGSSSVDAELMGLRSTGELVRDLRTRFESKELKRNHPELPPPPEVDTSTLESRAKSVGKDSADYTAGSQYLRVIPTPEGDGDTSTMASDRYVDTDSLAYLKPVQHRPPKKEDDKKP